MTRRETKTDLPFPPRLSKLQGEQACSPSYVLSLGCQDAQCLLGVQHRHTYRTGPETCKLLDRAHSCQQAWLQARAGARASLPYPLGISGTRGSLIIPSSPCLWPPFALFTFFSVSYTTQRVPGSNHLGTCPAPQRGLGVDLSPAIKQP